MEERSPYRLLGVPYGSDLKTIKEAYRTLAKKYHPDASQRSYTGEKFAKITEAYKKLEDRKKREQLVNFPVNKQWEQKGFRNYRVKRDVFSIGDMLLKGTTPGMRAFAARSLGNSGKKSAYAYLKKGVFDSEKQVILSSLWAIGRLNIKQCAGLLSEVFNNNDSEVRMEVLNTVEIIQDGYTFKNIILAAMKDNDTYIRKKALRLFSNNY